MIRLATYGTLRHGQPNWARLLADAPLLGTHCVPGFALYDAGPFPYAAPRPGGRIVVDLFAIDPAALAACDRLEGYPHHYDRRRIPVAGTPAWLFFVPRPPTGCRLIPGGDWLAR